MLVLALDTALQRCSAAIWRDGAVLTAEIEDREKGHAERIAPMVDALLRKAVIRPKDLDRLGVIVGPGGFTGVRVGLAFARAMGLAAGAGVVGVASLEALAANVGDGAVAPVIDARRGQVYAALYEDGESVLAPFVANPADAASKLAGASNGPLSLVGTGAPLLPSRETWRLANADPQIDPVIVARLAAAAPSPLAMPAPLYLRAPDAKPARL